LRILSEVPIFGIDRLDVGHIRPGYLQLEVPATRFSIRTPLAAF
jgi:hypothetical protein